ncbi:hypothetical protein, partial [Paludisphaera rhizosphaerae]|uniref:hypothetical protein n=1 Tax=Paludisphaera rhizosphaerae TaxID=2711216 RepID=UPI0013EBE0B7
MTQLEARIQSLVDRLSDHQAARTAPPCQVVASPPKIVESTPVDLALVALKCPMCDNEDKSLMFVNVPVWIRCSDR